ncbi:MAG: tryptophan--tRNA ligase, partial [Gemmatimonadales bacterium]
LDCKRVLADNMAEHFAPMRERARELRSDPDRVRETVAAGAERARRVARETMREVRERMGLLPALRREPSPA